MSEEMLTGVKHNLKGLGECDLYENRENGISTFIISQASQV